MFSFFRSQGQKKKIRIKYDVCLGITSYKSAHICSKAVDVHADERTLADSTVPDIEEVNRNTADNKLCRNLHHFLKKRILPDHYIIYYIH